MNLKLGHFFFVTLLLVACQGKGIKKSGKSYEPVCGPFYIHQSHLSIFNQDSFTSNEKLLICGSNTPGWKNPPHYQVKNFIQNFLNQRGYFNIKFTNDKDRILIDPGKISKVETIKFHKTPPNFLENQFVGIKGQPLSSQNLDQIKQWSETRLRSLAYPCPEVTIRAKPTDNSVDVYLNPKSRERVSQLTRTKLDGLNPKTLSRFDAFQINNPYKDENFVLTSRRLINSGLVDYSDFHNHCDNEDRLAHSFSQEITFAKPRKFIFAIGGTTEEYPILKLSWEHNRMDYNASQFTSELYASSRKQSLNSNLRWFPFNNSPRLHLIPEVEVARYSEDIYEALSEKLGLGLASSIDTFTKRFRWQLSPTYNTERTFRGEGPLHTSYFSLDSQLTLMSHDFEFYQNAPRKGYFLDLNWTSRQRGLGSSISLNRYLLNGKYLMNWGGFDPPLIVFGLRYQIAFLDIDNIDDAPTSNRLFLGGDDNLRGFPRKSLNNQGFGYSSYFYVGGEARFLQILPYQFQPFLLFDVAKVALVDTNFIDPLLTSAGLGMRWQSPFGSFRSTLAYGMIDDHKQFALGPTDQWKVFFSFGKEF